MLSKLLKKFAGRPREGLVVHASEYSSPFASLLGIVLPSCFLGIDPLAFVSTFQALCGSFSGRCRCSANEACLVIRHELSISLSPSGKGVCV